MKTKRKRGGGGGGGGRGRKRWEEGAEAGAMCIFTLPVDSLRVSEAEAAASGLKGAER